MRNKRNSRRPPPQNVIGFRKGRRSWKPALFLGALLAMVLLLNLLRSPIDWADINLEALPGSEEFEMIFARETFLAGSDIVRVIDADTIAVGNRRVRLAGVAAPEDGHPSHTPGRHYLGQLIRSASEVRCHLNGERNRDREIGRCFLTDSKGEVVDMQRAVVAAGFARSCLSYGGWRYMLSETSESRRLPLPTYCW